MVATRGHTLSPWGEEVGSFPGFRLQVIGFSSRDWGGGVVSLTRWDRKLLDHGSSDFEVE
jgi:hypothetical protein